MTLQVHQVLPWAATPSLLSVESYASALEVLLPLSGRPPATVARPSPGCILLRRQQPRHPGLYVVVASSSAASDVALQLFEAGLADVAVRGAVPTSETVGDLVKEGYVVSDSAGPAAAVVLISDAERPDGEERAGDGSVAVLRLAGPPNEMFLFANVLNEPSLPATALAAVALAASNAQTVSAVIDPHDYNDAAFSMNMVTGHHCHPNGYSDGHGHSLGTAATEHAHGNSFFSTASAAVSSALSRLRLPPRSGNATEQKSRKTYAVQISALNGLPTISFGVVVSDVLAQLDSLLGAPASAVTTANFSTGRGPAHTFGFAISVMSCDDTAFFPPPPPPPSPKSLSLGGGSLPEEVTRKRRAYAAATRAVVEAGCRRLIAAEPEITRMDVMAGDGDCGTTLKAGATAVLSRVLGIDPASAKDATPFRAATNGETGQGTLADLLDDVADALESSMGGTSGIVLTILFRGWARAAAGAAGAGRSEETGIDFVADSLNRGLETLLAYTPARKNDRTLLDALIPFAEALRSGGGGGANDDGGDRGRSSRMHDAVRAAREGCEATKSMRPGLGRAIYVPREEIEGVPDAGALGVLRVVEGMEETTREIP